MGNAPRTILITGATGFIGSALVKQLRERGDRVIALTRDPERARRQLGSQLHYATRLDGIGADVAVDAIVNLAGEPIAGGPWTAARKQRFVASRVGTTRALVDWLQARRQQAAALPAVLVSGSAIGYYGERGDETLTETSAPRPEFMSTLCQQWEAEAERAQALGLRVCRLRTGLVLGRHGGLLAPLLLSTQCGLGSVFGNGAQWQSWIHLDDELGLILHLLDHDVAGGAYNATAPEPVRQREFADQLARACGRPRWLRTPAVALRLLGEMSELFLGSQRVLPRASQAAGYRFRYERLDSALADLLSR